MRLPFPTPRGLTFLRDALSVDSSPVHVIAAELYSSRAHVSPPEMNIRARRRSLCDSLGLLQVLR